MSSSEGSDVAAVDLAGRDPALPLLPVLLDDAALSTWLAARLQQDLVARRTYLRYKPGTAVLTTVRLHARGSTAGARTVMVGHWAHDAHAKLAKTCARARPEAVLLVDDASEVLVTTPGADRHLPALARLEDPERRGRLLRAVTGDPGLRCETLSYKPQRRWVGRSTGSDGAHHLLRAFRPADLDRHVDHLRLLADAGVPVPRLTGTDPRLGLAGVEWVPGDRLVLEGPALGCLGEALGRLHTHPVPLASLPGAGLPARVRGLRRTAAQVARLQPDLAAPVEAATEQVVEALERLASSRPARSLLHGDLSSDQAVVTPDGQVRLIDLDRARAGDPADDLGSLAASARLDGTPEPVPGSVLGSVLDGYARHAEPPAAGDLAAYTAAQLLARATDPFRSGRHDWPERMRDAVEGAAGCLR